MSNINVRRAVDNIRGNTNVYTPIIECIVNSIQAIESKGEQTGRVEIRIIRSIQTEADGGIPDVVGFEIEDNGIGFTDTNRDSFDTLYTDYKINEGGKGFGRFTCLKYFEDLHIKSIFQHGGVYKQRSFSMGKEKDIIVNEHISESKENTTKTIIHLKSLRESKFIDKKLDTMGRNIAEKLLPFFIAKDYTCPEIILAESDSPDKIRLNDFFNNQLSRVIVEVPIEKGSFNITSVVGNESFQFRMFKLYFPKSQKSKISLVAHKREVAGSALEKYVPEFSEDFYERAEDNGSIRDKNYILKAYVFSDYLDRHVLLEHAGFAFHMESDLLYGIAQIDIEKQVAELAKNTAGADIKVRQEKKRERIQTYVDDEAPWHKDILAEIDIADMPYNPSKEDIETKLQKVKFAQEMQIKRDVLNIMQDGTLHTLKQNANAVVSKISGTSKNDLVHYIALRRNILDVFAKSLEVDATGSYSSEGVVHDIIFPRKGDTDNTAFENHNLWILDVRLNFTNYVSSDQPLYGNKSERPDLLVYNKRILFRGDNETTNPITIFEFKKPQRDDFVNPSSEEDPVQQIVRYVNNIRDGKFKTPEGRKILVVNNTPFYGFVVCDLTAKVENWLERENNFKPMPDRMGWFQWLENINLYIEVISWDKVLKDAEMRNRIFFHKLGI